MRTIRLELGVGPLVTVGLLGVLAATAGLATAGWMAGAAVGVGVTALLAAGRIRCDDKAIQPADWVTLARAWLAAGVTALVADSMSRPLEVGATVALSAVALALDAVDGRVARHTGTANPLGARFDGEVDAWLILVLSVAVAQQYGVWVLAVGAARYVFLVAGWLLPWLRGPLPARYWRKVVAAVQGVVLTVAVSGRLDRPVGIAAVAVALALLVESFGRDVLWLYRAGAGPRTRVALRRVGAVAAPTVVWVVLVVPDRVEDVGPGAFVRIPLELLVLVAIALVLSPRMPRVRRVVAAIAGLLFGLVTVVKVLDMGFYEQLGRPFDPVLDKGNLAPAIGVLRDAIGAPATALVLGAAGLAVAVLIAVVVAAGVRLCTLAARYRRSSARALAALATTWVVAFGMSLHLVPGVPLASNSAATVAIDHVRTGSRSARDAGRFAASLQAPDAAARVAASDLLGGLRGKDVLIVFVESYGKVALQGKYSSAVDAVLRDSTTALERSGFHARSGWLTSPTFGGISWLAHATLQSGLWVDNQERYDSLVTTDRLTLTAAFGKAGWRTVSVIPAGDRTWGPGSTFYHYEQFYDRRNLGYRGPMFSYAPMPDQYTLDAFAHRELGPGHRPVMAEIDLVSSHTPWTPLPRMVPWDRLGDGSVFDPMPALGLTPAAAWSDADTVRRLYAESIRYSLQALTAWITHLADPNLVVVMLGDHQPSTIVSGVDAGHEVPVSMIAADPSVLARTASWQWTDGLRPDPAAAAWPMDAFRDRFFAAFDTARN